MTPDNKTAKRRVLLVDDHPLMREGLAQLINGQDDLMVCGEVEDRDAALDALDALAPDLAVVDLSLREESGLELIKDIRARAPHVVVLVLSMHDETLYAERALRAGARGYVMKREASQRVLDAIRHTLDGGVAVSERIVATILESVGGRRATDQPAAVAALSDRELEVLTLVGHGYSSRDIGLQLSISSKTVEAHRANIKDKLGLQSGSELLQFAIRCNRRDGLP
jgi:DNA-binding NarL/FixJ family response regulator